MDRNGEDDDDSVPIFFTPMKVESSLIAPEGLLSQSSPTTSIRLLFVTDLAGSPLGAALTNGTRLIGSASVSSLNCSLFLRGDLVIVVSTSKGREDLPQPIEANTPALVSTILAFLSNECRATVDFVFCIAAIPLHALPNSSVSTKLQYLQATSSSHPLQKALQTFQRFDGVCHGLPAAILNYCTPRSLPASVVLVPRAAALSMDAFKMLENLFPFIDMLLSPGDTFIRPSSEAYRLALRSDVFASRTVNLYT